MTEDVEAMQSCLSVFLSADICGADGEVTIIKK